MDELVCPVCGGWKKEGYLTCKDCHYEFVEFLYGLKICSMNEYRDHYFNLKDTICRMPDHGSVERYCNKLIAIAYMNKSVNSDSSLCERVMKDIKEIITCKKPNEEEEKQEEGEKKQKINNEEFEEAEKSDEGEVNIFLAVDGHMVKSHMERIIDDILWNAEILHAYEQPITEFVYERKKCDWFIPIMGMRQGIYIEYWGMDTPKYMEARKEKEDLYKKYNVPYIGIEKDAPKDTHSFRSILLQELQRKAMEVYGFMPKWKK